MEDEILEEALVLLAIKLGEVWNVAKELNEITGITKTLVVTGSWDIAILLRYEHRKLGNLIRTIQEIDGVVQTMTLIGVPEPSNI